MNKIIILMILSIFVTLVPTKHALHMFQQNRYELTRYTTWLKENISTILKENVIPIVSFILITISAFFFDFLPVFITECIVYVFIAIYSIHDEKQEKYIKPLVYTDRVKRQIVVMTILFLIGIFFLRSSSFLILFATLGPWILIYLMSIITSPIEKGVQNQFLNDAKKRLQEHSRLKIIGITGSYGKTSTKNVVRSILSEKYNTLMTPASYNTPMGITRTIREMLKPIHEVFVCEMGADKVGDITELMNFVHPSIGIVTSIGPQHLQTFGSQENITHEKMQIIEMLPKDGIGILNYDNELIRSYTIKNDVKIITYGIDHEDVDYRAINIEYHQNGSSFTVIHGDEKIELTTKLLGKLNILNILSAIACARSLNVSWKEIERGVKEMKQVEHRLELKKISGLSFIDDAFNANPAGAKMALEVLKEMPGKRFIVTPGMIDLGSKQAEINKEFGQEMKDHVDTVILVGVEQTKPILEGLRSVQFDENNILVTDTVQEAFQYIYKNATPSDTILLENDLPDAFNK